MPHVELPQLEFKVVLLGDTNTGKTSLVLRFAEGHYRESARSPTLGAFFLTKRLTVHHNMTCKMLLWDTAGQEPFQKLAVTYYRTAAAAILTYDVSQPHSLWKLRTWCQDVLKNTAGRRIVLIMAACKGDLEAAPGLEEEAQRLAQSVGAGYIKTSAKNNTNVNELFQQTAEAVLTCHVEAVQGHGPYIPVTVAGQTEVEDPAATATSSAWPSGSPGMQRPDASTGRLRRRRSLLGHAPLHLAAATTAATSAESPLSSTMNGMSTLSSSVRPKSAATTVVSSSASSSPLLGLRKSLLGGTVPAAAPETDSSSNTGLDESDEVVENHHHQQQHQQHLNGESGPATAFISSPTSTTPATHPTTHGTAAGATVPTTTTATSDSMCGSDYVCGSAVDGSRSCVIL